MSTDNSTTSLKRCTKKEQCVHPENRDGWLPASPKYFSPDRRHSDGFQCQCKSCQARGKRHKRAENPEKMREYDRRRYAENPERYRERNRRGYANHIEKRREARKRDYHKNPKKSLDNNKKWRRDHPEKRRAGMKRWYDNNRSVVRVHRHNYEARKCALPATFTTAEWERCLAYWNHCCCICGRPAGLWHTIAQEHWIAVTDPREDNPGTVAANILPMCHSMKDGQGGCNNSKHNKNPIEWVTSTFGKRKAKHILARIEAYFEWVKGQNRP